MMDNLGSDAKVFLDANNLSSDGTISLADYAFSEDGLILAYALSTNGADWRQIRFKSTITGMPCFITAFHFIVMVHVITSAVPLLF